VEGRDARNRVGGRGVEKNRVTGEERGGRKKGGEEGGRMEGKGGG